MNYLLKLIDEKSPQELEELSQIQSNTDIIQKEDGLNKVLNQDYDKNINFDLPKELKESKKLFDWLETCDVKTHKIASLVSLFTIVSAVTVRAYFTETRASTTLYIIFIGKTGLGKNSIYKAPMDLLNKVHQGDKIIPAKITSEGAIDDLFREKNLFVQVSDEFGDVLKHMLNDKGGWLQAVAAKIKSLYSLTNGIYKPNVYSSSGGKKSKAKYFQVYKPCYGLTGITTKHQLLTAFDESKLHDGFINRFIILNGYGIEPKFNKKPNYDIPKEIIEHIKSIRISQVINDELLNQLQKKEDFDESIFFNKELNYFENDVDKIVKLSKEAFDFYHNYIGDADIKESDIFNYCENDEDETKRAISARWRENTIRLATALTAYENKDEISLDVLRWCYFLIKQSSIDFLNMFNNESTTSKYEQLKKRVIGWFKYNKAEVSLSHLSTSATVFKSLKARERNELLDDLVEANIISKRSEKTGNSKKETSYYQYLEKS